MQFWSSLPEPFIWDLRDPIQFIQCLYFLWELKKHLNESFRDDSDSFDISKLTGIVKQNPFWRNFGESKKQRKDGKSESDSKRSKPNDSEDQVVDDVDMMDGADEDPRNISHSPRPLTLRDIILKLPFIYDELLKVARIEEWKKSVAASEHEGTL